MPPRTLPPIGNAPSPSSAAAAIAEAREQRRLRALALNVVAKLEQPLSPVPAVDTQDDAMAKMEAGPTPLPAMSPGGTRSQVLDKIAGRGLTAEDFDDVVERVRTMVCDHQSSAWRAVLGHIVTQLGRAGVVAAELWTRTKTVDGDVELHRGPGGFFFDDLFSPPADALDDFEKLEEPSQKPSVPGMGLAGIHWSEGVDRGEGGDVEEGSHHSGGHFNPERPSREQLGRQSREQLGRQSRETIGHRVRRHSKEGHERDSWEWVRLDYMANNPELILDDHARHAARVFGFAHFLKFRSKTDDFGGVVVLYTRKEAIEDNRALYHASARSFGLTIPRLIASNCVTIPFQLNMGALLREFREVSEQTAYVIMWVVSGGQYRIIAHFVGEERRRKLREMRGDKKSFANESYGFAIDPVSNGPIPLAARTGNTQLVANTGASDERQPREFKRAPLLAEFGIRDVFFVPVPLGVLEFGLPKTPRDAAMEEIRKFTDSTDGASSVFSYVLFWSISDKDGLFHVVADYVNEDRKRKLRELRGDDKTFCSESYGTGIDPHSKSPVSLAHTTGQQQSVTDAFSAPGFQRRDLANEFNIQHVFWVPASIGVIEYGTPRCENDDEEAALSAAQEKFINDKVKEIARATRVASLRAEKARRLSIGGGISLQRASTRTLKLAHTSKGILHRVLFKMAGAKGAKAPKVRFSRESALTCACTWLGVFLSLFALSGVDRLVVGLSEGQFVVILGSWGALMTLLFSAPASPLVQPRNIFGGNLVSAIVAILFYYLTGSEYLEILPRWLALALAPATAISAMQFFGVSHPPAGAVSLIFITGSPTITGMQWLFLLCPLLLGNIIAVLLASWINNLSSKRQYPMYW